MLQSRRGFLIGAGSLLTAAFVTEAQAFVRRAAKPLLAEQVEAQHTLYWYLPKGSNAPLLCLDGSPFIVPPPPTWREFIHGICMRLIQGKFGLKVSTRGGAITMSNWINSTCLSTLQSDNVNRIFG